MLKILITTPPINSLGGVASYIKSTTNALSNFDLKIEILEIGSSKSRPRLITTIQDQYKFSKCIYDNVDLVHINPSLNLKSLIRDGLFLIQAKHKGLPVIVFFRGWNHKTEATIEKYFKSLFRWVYSRADVCIVLASKFKDKLLHWSVAAPIYLETTCVDDRLIEKQSIETIISNRKKDKVFGVLFLARLEEEKGLFETIQAVVSLQDKGLPIKLTVAGDGPAKYKLVKVLKKLARSKDQIDFIGYVDGEKKINAFLTSDIYCFPSAYGEGLPNSVLEAMAFGMPVICTNVGGLSDIFQDKKMGCLVKPKAVEELIYQLEKLISDPVKIVKISRYNFRYAADNFLASVVAGRMFNIYQEIMSKHR